MTSDSEKIFSRFQKQKVLVHRLHRETVIPHLGNLQDCEVQPLLKFMSFHNFGVWQLVIPAMLIWWYVNVIWYWNIAENILKETNTTPPPKKKKTTIYMFNFFKCIYMFRVSLQKERRDSKNEPHYKKVGGILVISHTW